MSHNNNSHLLFGLIAGATLGAVAGMLFSPHKGSVSRRIILRKGEDLADVALETIEDRIEKLGDALNKHLETFTSDLKSRYREVCG
ncbi:MAG: YtxH domain-containing protein [Bacteroidota bacterium]|nr:YtxH domain-containing protein [Bacteroidota bacterium]MDP4234164.1 YtxH domain-containing protein [Bacteroidota bacterium]MDP4244014.1 YtxH domain-containing protein [Bacteroidota bacterium]MDP4287864.1 YtxH domain-containing protein [Bacteroidota bacterium]